MEKVDERSCRGNMVIGQGLFPKSYIQIEESSEISDCLKKNPFLLKIEFCMYSRSLSRRVAVVEPVRSVRLFFESKLESLRTEAIPQSCEKWWKYIENDFRSIFRGIVGGMHALYLADEVCGDLGNSIYVTEEGDAKLFHVFEGKFTYVQAQKEVGELWSVMESVITLISPRPTPKTDLNTWMKEFRVYYKLPDELCHFLRSLRAKKLGGFIEPTWLIDHPFIWSINHRVWFIKTLEEFIKERKFNLIELNRRLHPNFGASWRPRVLIDPLLVAIYDYNGEDFYTRNACHIINYIHGIFFHANDFRYDNLRWKKGGLSVEELEMLVAKVFPDIYTILYDALHAYAENVNEAKYVSLSQVLQRCSSFAGR